MNCSKCNVSFNSKMLYRTTPYGQQCNKWLCEKCMKKMDIPIPFHEDLNEFKILKDIEKAVLKHDNKKLKK